MTLTHWLIAGAAAAAAIAFAYWLGYKVGHYHGRRLLGAVLRQQGSALGNRL